MPTPKSVIYVHRAEDVPACEHWAIIEGTSVTIPGDERSRTAPGHGYPEHTESYITYVAYLNQAEFESELERMVQSNLKYHSSKTVRGIHVSGIYVTKTVVQLTEKK